MSLKDVEVQSQGGGAEQRRKVDVGKARILVLTSRFGHPLDVRIQQNDDARFEHHTKEAKERSS